MGKGPLQRALTMLGRCVHPFLSPTPPRAIGMSQGIHGPTARRKLKLSVLFACLCGALPTYALSMGELHYFDASVHQKVLDQTSNVILDPNSHLPPKETSPNMHIRALCSGINALRLSPILQEVRKKAVCTGNRRASHPPSTSCFFVLVGTALLSQ